MRPPPPWDELYKEAVMGKDGSLEPQRREEYRAVRGSQKLLLTTGLGGGHGRMWHHMRPELPLGNPRRVRVRRWPDPFGASYARRLRYLMIMPLRSLQ